MLKASLSENDIELTASQTNDLLDATFLEADKDKDGFINFQEYEALVDAHPDMLSQMTIDIRAKIEEYHRKEMAGGGGGAADKK